MYRLLLVLGRLTADDLAIAADAVLTRDLGSVRTEALSAGSRAIGYLRPSDDEALREIVPPSEGLGEEPSPFECRPAEDEALEGGPASVEPAAGGSAPWESALLERGAADTLLEIHDRVR
ncbi:MAG: hypothetical protein FJX56_03735 [Alphaproteobacteria bacterium]|nr:hypothetical protein [Alphaproteobacteria bacterium]